ncbi:MAG TPA: DUF92 domain-containing protein [Petrotogaceae bacterium]|jgi:uncharacterized protein (TIGR00297 family)|nr:DUF92 domain-containing protein [Petrotogaceae bacterium]HNY37204.1 DUF92 domain-containing protein [Petrotogaceae bacterium]HPG48054.1 DUF92 domain-containing protein [Petrotogaceae bacterium]HPO27672.1 DUF92 domain-containing protein [Petrotogaceae bacterium]
MLNFVIGLVLSFIISFYAYRKKSLTLSGVAGAMALGASLYFFGGFLFFTILIAFFVSSTLLTKFKKSEKKDTEIIAEKSGRRDYSQVIANGLPAFLTAFLYYITQNHIFMLGFAVSMASSNSDTWASELGVLSKNQPVSILTWKRIKKGMSGGISLLGTLASLLGSLVISLIFTIGYALKYGAGITFKNIVFAFAVCFLGGFIGSIIDSLLGASVQALYYCEKLKIYTERRFFDESENKLVKGVKFMNNNMVNFLSGLLASLLSMVLFILTVNI